MFPRTVITTLMLTAMMVLPARAQTKITIGVTSSTTWSTVFIAADQGIFAKHDLAATISIVALNPAILSAVQAGSLQIGAVSPAGLLQAVDGDLDFVAVAGGVISADKATRASTGTGVLVRQGIEIRSPQDFMGKKIGVPGLGSGLDIGFRLWLKNEGVNYRNVDFVELSFPQQSDALRSRIVDGVISVDPFFTRIINAKTGYLAFDFLNSQDDGVLQSVYVATRRWAASFPQATRDFRRALADAYAFQVAHPDAARTIIGKFLELQPDAVAHATLYTMQADIHPSQLQYWADPMVEQGWIKKLPDIAKLIFN